jgi:hypothetical protein
LLNYETFMSLLKECINWDKSYMIEYICNNIKCNIIVYNDVLKSKNINGGNMLNKEYPCIMFVLKDKYEYYPLYKEVDGKKVYILSYNEIVS